MFYRLQEAVRRDVERLYRVLTARFRIAVHPARYRTGQHLTTTAKAITILHNLSVEVRRDSFAGRQRSAKEAAEAATGAGAGALSVAFGVAIDEPASVADESGPSAAYGAAFDETAPVNAVAGPSADPDHAGAGSGGNGGDLAALPQQPAPHFEHADDAIEGTLCQGLLAWSRTTDTGEHIELRNDLAEHVWDDRIQLFLPYL